MTIQGQTVCRMSSINLIVINNLDEPPHQKMFSKAYRASEDQPAHALSLFSAFAVRSKVLWIVLYIRQKAKALERQDRCVDWPESSLGAYNRRHITYGAAQLFNAYCG